MTVSTPHELLLWKVGLGVEQNSDSAKRDKKIATGEAVKEVLEKANAEEKLMEQIR
jgi:hypothetical protein